VDEAARRLAGTPRLCLTMPTSITVSDSAVVITRTDYTVVGRNVHIAARLEGASAHGRILISDATWKLLDGKFPGQSNGEVKLKGLDQPVLTHWVN
jgi:class 3 adenylate cyclase